jgi:hypothetical protein
MANQLDKQTELSPKFNNKYENRRQAIVRALGARHLRFESCSLFKTPVSIPRSTNEFPQRAAHILRYRHCGWAGGVEDVLITQSVTYMIQYVGGIHSRLQMSPLRGMERL